MTTPTTYAITGYNGSAMMMIGDKEEDFIREQQKRILKRAKLKLLVISSLMTAGLFAQLILIRLLRKKLREWNETILLVQAGFLDVEEKPKEVKPMGKRKKKTKRRKTKARRRRSDEKMRKRRSKERSGSKASAEAIRSKDRSLFKLKDDIDDLYNFFDRKSAEKSEERVKSLSKEKDKRKDFSSDSKESKSADSKEDVVKPKGSLESKSQDSLKELGKKRKSKEEIATKSAEKLEKSAEKSAEKLAEKSLDKSAEKSADKSADSKDK
ncbi:unnamed protein product [Haemonchus placei]|uniref:FoP_duplication domain-containing protein n=1 Tax=Haemonchus placei TaxID=6290 RepID=A0A0N4X6H6_HAEPC|nr:unnamed protein product [Haemonchus placei]